ncbi:hypothetical protein IT409_02090 [Candidatus Falkowbacteria bacterium]|nr:hypothetical protein [Candidatus Falkowbacteria bacterium]
MDFSKIISASYWMQSRPGELSTPYEVLFLVVLVLMYGIYIASRFISKKEDAMKNRIYAQYWQKFGTFAFTMAVIFTFVFFFRYEAVPYLGGRYWTLLWIIGFVVWLGTLLYEYYKVLPKKVAERMQRLGK